MAFVFKVTTTTSPQTFTIPCQNIGTFNATVDWGDGGPTSSITAYNDADLAHSYATAGQYTITITGTFPNIYFNYGGDRLLVDEVVDLGDVGWTRLNGAFNGCSNMTVFDGGTTDTSSVTNMGSMLANCSSLTSLNITSFNTSSVTNISFMFYNCSSLTSLDVSGFDTSSVTNTSYMFSNSSSLTSLDLSSFDTSSVTNMQSMFQGCSSLTGLQISGWDVSSVTNGTNFLSDANNALSQAEYDAILKNWSLQPVQSGVTWHFGDAVYSVDPIAVSIKIDGRMTGDTYTLTRWHEDADNYIVQEAGASDFDFEQSSVTVVDTVTGGSFTSGILVPYTIASRHGSTFINGAVDGTALTANTTPTSLPDLSATDLNLGYDYMGTIKEFAIWNVDLTDAGIEEASS